MKNFKNAPAFDGLKKIKLNKEDNSIVIKCSQSQRYILDEVKDNFSLYFTSRGINYPLVIKTNEIDVDKQIEELDEAKERVVLKELEKARQMANEMNEVASEVVKPIKKSKYAYDEVKQVANYVTSNSVEEAGFAEAIYKFVPFN